MASDNDWKRAKNYVSNRDPIPWLHPFARLSASMGYRPDIQILDPAPGASYIDHGFMEPTYRAVVSDHLKQILNKGKKND